MLGEAGSDRAAAGRSGMPRERRRVVFSGRVQGVGFRFTCRSLARGFDVAGYVRNLADGRVELVAGGEPSEVDGFLDGMQREMGCGIAGVATASELAGAHPLAGFSLRD